MNQLSRVMNVLAAIAAAAVGGGLGYVLFWWAHRQGIYLLVLPGAMIGMGCQIVLRQKSILVGILCALGAFFLGSFIEWQRAPFAADPGFPYFLKHVHQVDTTLTLVMLLVGSGFAFWFGRGTEGRVRPRQQLRMTSLDAFRTECLDALRAEGLDAAPLNQSSLALHEGSVELSLADYVERLQADPSLAGDLVSQVVRAAKATRPGT